jgi:hypothetical protein
MGPSGNADNLLHSRDFLLTRILNEPSVKGDIAPVKKHRIQRAWNIFADISGFGVSAPVMVSRFFPCFQNRTAENLLIRPFLVYF